MGREKGVGDAEDVARLEVPLRDGRGVDHRAPELAALAAPLVVQQVLHRVAPARRAVYFAVIPRLDDRRRRRRDQRDLVDVEARLREAREEDVVGRGRVGRPERRNLAALQNVLYSREGVVSNQAAMNMGMLHTLFEVRVNCIALPKV